jgi:hypothetical protein
MEKEKVIARAVITKPTDMFTCPEVFVVFEGEAQKHRLFEYFPDEISFSPEEFVGLTKRQAHELKARKDLAYLKS